MMNKSDTIKELATALAKAQGEIENATKATNNAFFKSKYADLAECLNTVRPVFSKHGLSLSQFPSFEGGVASVESILMHASGEWISSTASAPVSKQDAQGVGSATTYLRRYSLAAIAGIAQEDDDANSAVGKHEKQQPVNNAISFITKDQVANIESLITELSVNKSDFLTWAKVNELSQIKTEHYEIVINRLESKRNPK